MHKPFAALLALPLVAASPGPATSGTEEVPPVDEQAIAKDRSDRMTVPVTISGTGPYRFFIDTGAQATVVTHEIVESLGLPRAGLATLVAMGSSRTVETVELDDLEFANRSISGLVSPLLDAEHVGADGILGLDSLQDLRVLIDFRERRMLVADAETLGGSNDYEIVVRARQKLGQMIIADAKVNGIRTAVIIDTGSQNSIANFALRDRMRAREQDRISSLDVLGAEVISNASYLRKLSLGSARMENVPVGFNESPIFAALGLSRRPALVLGISNLRVFDRVAIDFAERRILFDVPRDTPTRTVTTRIDAGWN